MAPTTRTLAAGPYKGATLLTVTATSEQTTPTAPGVPEGRPTRWDHEHEPGRWGWVFAAIWLFYLVDPLHYAVTSSRAALVWRVVAVVALLVFAAGFVLFFARWRQWRIVGEHPADAVVWPVLALGVALLALATPGAGVAALSGLVYLGVTAVMTMSLRPALAVVAGAALIMLLVPRVVPGWPTIDDAVPSLLLGCFAAYGVSQMIERNRQLAHAREQLVDLAVTRERERMGRDVHDILGHSLTVITVKTELAGRLLEAVPVSPARDRALAEVADVERLAREALADVRATASGTRKVSLTGELAGARAALAAAGIRADLPTAVDLVPARYRELFAWALREGITNVVRHSGASWCGVQLTADHVEVRDDGRGPGNCAGGGNGLTGLQARAAKAAARLEVERAPEGGFLLRVVAEGTSA